MLRIKSFGKTDVGRVRKNNEDAFIIRPELDLWDSSRMHYAIALTFLQDAAEADPTLEKGLLEGRPFRGIVTPSSGA